MKLHETYKLAVTESGLPELIPDKTLISDKTMQAYACREVSVALLVAGKRCAMARIVRRIVHRRHRRKADQKQQGHSRQHRGKASGEAVCIYAGYGS